MGRPAGRLKSEKSPVFTESGTTGRLFYPAAWRQPASNHQTGSNWIKPKLQPIRTARQNYGNLSKWLYVPFLLLGLVLTFVAALGSIGMVIWAILFA